MSRYIFAAYIHANVDIISPGKVSLFIYLFIKVPDILKRWIKKFCQMLALLALQPIAAVGHVGERARADFIFQERLFLQSCTLFFPSQHKHASSRACSCMLVNACECCWSNTAAHSNILHPGHRFLQRPSVHTLFLISCCAAKDLKSFRAVIAPGGLLLQLFCVLLTADSNWSEGLIDVTLVALSSITQPVISCYITAVSTWTWHSEAWVASATCGEQRFSASTCPDDRKPRIQEALLMSVVPLVVSVHLRSTDNGLK